MYSKFSIRVMTDSGYGMPIPLHVPCPVGVVRADWERRLISTKPLQRVVKLGANKFYSEPTPGSVLY